MARFLSSQGVLRAGDGPLRIFAQRRLGPGPVLEELSIFGSPVLGETVSADFVATGAEPLAATFQWGIVGAGDLPGETGPSYQIPNSTNMLSARLYCRVRVENPAGAVEQTAETAPVGLTFVENWSRFAVGDLLAALVAQGYVEVGGSGQPVVTVIDEPDPQFDKSLNFRPGGANARSLSYRPLTELIAGATVDYVEFLIQIENNAPDNTDKTIFFKTQASADPNAPSVSTSTGCGINIRRDGSNVRFVHHQLPGDDATSAVGTRLGAWPGGRLGSINGDVYNVRVRISGVNSKARLWMANLGEPEAWGADRNAAAPIPINGFVLGGRTGTVDRHNIRFWSFGVNTPAPWPVGYVPPAPENADPLSFQAPASLGSIVSGGEAITFEFGDL